MKKLRTVLPNEFEPHLHWYPKALNATIHPMISFFLSLGQERIITRYLDSVLVPVFLCTYQYNLDGSLESEQSHFRFEAICIRRSRHTRI